MLQADPCSIEAHGTARARGAPGSPSRPASFIHTTAAVLAARRGDSSVQGDSCRNRSALETVLRGPGATQGCWPALILADHSLIPPKSRIQNRGHRGAPQALGRVAGVAGPWHNACIRCTRAPAGSVPIHIYIPWCIDTDLCLAQGGLSFEVKSAAFASCHSNCGSGLWQHQAPPGAAASAAGASLGPRRCRSSLHPFHPLQPWCVGLSGGAGCMCSMKTWQCW